MATTAQETDQIARTVNLYVDGIRDGDAGRLREAFHPDTRMWGSMMGQRYDEPIEEMIAMVDGQPGDVDGSYHARITSIEQTDDVAAAVLIEEGFWGTLSFVDFFALARIEGAWKIVNKVFVHTGGEPPAAE
jgi:hypothetical protein